MQLTFLQAAVPLTKKYTLRTDGRYDKTSYPNVSRVTSHLEEVTTPTEFAAALRKHAEDGNCLHTGSLDAVLKTESRKGHHDKDEKRAWIVLDLDGLQYPTVEDAVQELPDAFHSVSYIAQHSPSSGINPGLRVHLFFLLDRDESMSTVRDWLKYTNLVTKSLRDQITLTASNKALSFKLDVIANANGRVVYITAPECVGFSDPIKDRIQVVSKQYDELRYAFASVSPGDLKHEYRKCVDEIRADRGLPKLRAKELYEQRGDIEVLKKDQTDKGRIHDCTQDSDIIMRCNIDGGDSDAYFYYIKYPGLVRNHKGEPALYMAQFDPDYYEKVALVAARALWEKETQPFVYRNSFDDKYYCGLRVGDEITSQPLPVGSDAKIQDYYTQHGGLGVPSPIESWQMKFDPRLEKQWNPDEHVFNTWRQSELMANAMYRSMPPDVITKVITHAVGGDPTTYARFINWLAYIYQNRTKTGTAWILHGVQGTGKGLLVDHVLAPIFGYDYVSKQQSRNLKAEFNGWMERAIFVNIDEFDIQDAGAEATSVMQALKMWITDARLPIRAMHKESRMTDNYSNFILTTNSRSALPVDRGDRRISFGDRQEKRLDITPDEVDDIRFELDHFAGFLKTYKVDKLLAHTCLENATKDQAKQLSMTSIEEFVEAVRTGDLQFFLDAQFEKSSDFSLDGDYKILLERFIKNAKEEQPTYVTIHEMLVAFKVICKEDRTMKSNKFGKIMEHKNLPAHRLRLADSTRPRGWKVDWLVADAATMAEIKGHIKPVRTQEELEKKLEKEIVESP